MKALEQGQHMDLLSERITNKREERADLEKALAMEQMQYVSLTAMEIMFFFTRLKNGDINDIMYRKMLITVLVNSVYLYDDGRLAILFNATNGIVSVDVDLLDSIEAESGSFLNGVRSTKYFGKSEMRNPHYTDGIAGAFLCYSFGGYLYTSSFSLS